MTRTEEIIDTFHEELPEVFQSRSTPTDWEDDWWILPIDDAEASTTELERVSLVPPAVLRIGDTPIGDTPSRIPWAPVFPGNSFPGVPVHGVGGYGHPPPPEPPDALAFYLPFHYFTPTWWGVYLTVEGVCWLANFIAEKCGELCSSADALVPARVFLYFHEAYHHIVECFATRLETTHREALYKAGFDRFYGKTVGTDECIEEALATAYAWRKTNDFMTKKLKWPSAKRNAVAGALKVYIEGCPPGYRRAVRFLLNSWFESGQLDFAEKNHVYSLQKKALRPRAWSAFPHGFHGIGRINSHINYIVHRCSPIAMRQEFRVRYVKYRDLTKQLVAAGAHILRHGKGSHEIWRAPSGATFPVPRHRGDLAIGTVQAVLASAGIRRSEAAIME